MSYPITKYKFNIFKFSQLSLNEKKYIKKKIKQTH